MLIYCEAFKKAPLGAATPRGVIFFGDTHDNEYLIICTFIYMRFSEKVKSYLVEQHIVDGADSLVGVGTVDDAGDLDLAGGDHLDVDVVVGQKTETQMLQR